MHSLIFDRFRSSQRIAVLAAACEDLNRESETPTLRYSLSPCSLPCSRTLSISERRSVDEPSRKYLPKGSRLITPQCFKKKSNSSSFMLDNLDAVACTIQTISVGLAPSRPHALLRESPASANLAGRAPARANRLDALKAAGALP